MPMNTPYAKKPVVTCWSHSQGYPIVRVTTSHSTERVNPVIETPHRTMSTASAGSRAFHLRCRWRSSTRTRWSTINPPRSSARWMRRRRRSTGTAAAVRCGSRPPRRRERLLHLTNQLEDLHRVRAELLGELVLDRLGRLHEPRLVHAVDDLDAHALELRRRLLLEGEGPGRLDAPDLVGGGLHPLFFLIGETVPGLFAHPDVVV